jgi:K+-transporting ATPase ATPase C chain
MAAMKQQLKIALLMTIVTTVICGLLYPAAVTLLAHFIFPNQANGELILRSTSPPGSTVIGSRLIGQGFSGPGYFHSRPSAAGSGYDPTASGGSNLGPTNHALIDRVRADVEKLQAENPGAAIPVDLVTASGSGLDPDISPAAAEFQIPRVARARNVSPDALRALVRQHTLGRQFGILGEPRVNVLKLNLALDASAALQ